MTPEEFQKITPEQKKQISDIIRKSMFSVLFVTVKSMGILFLANIAAIAVGVIFLQDSTVPFQHGFQFCVFVLNTIFVCRYLTNQLKPINNKIITDIKEVVKNNKSE